MKVIGLDYGIKTNELEPSYRIIFPSYFSRLFFFSSNTPFLLNDLQSWEKSKKIVIRRINPSISYYSVTENVTYFALTLDPLLGNILDNSPLDINRYKLADLFNYIANEEKLDRSTLINIIQDNLYKLYSIKLNNDQLFFQKIYNYIIEKKGSISVSKVCLHFSLKDIYLNDLFEKNIQMKPKNFIQLIRLKKTLNLIFEEYNREYIVNQMNFFNESNMNIFLIENINMDYNKIKSIMSRKDDFSKKLYRDSEMIVIKKIVIP